MKVCHKVLFLFRLLAVVVRCSGSESLMWGIWEILLVPRLVTMASGLSGTHPNVTQCLCKPLTSRHVSHTVFALYFLALQLSCPHGLGKACSLAGGRLVAIKAACLGPTFLAHLTTRRKAKTYSILEEVKAVISQHG